MNEFLNLSPEDFNLFLLEEAQYRSPAEIDDLRRRYRDANSFAGAIKRTLAPEEGRRRASYAPVDAPEGMSIWDALKSGEASWAIPQGIVDLLSGGVRAVESPAEYAKGIPPRADALGDALNVAGTAMLGGGAVTRPAGSLGSNNIYGNTVDFNAFKKARAKEDLLGKVKAVVDDVSSGAYQARIDQSAFDLHKSGNLPLPVGTRVSPPSSYEMGNDLRISGYWVDPQDANVFGYKLQNDAGEEFREFVNNPRLGIGSRSADRFGGGFKAFAGPNADDRFGFSALSSSFTQTAAREPIPDSIQKEYDALFGNPLMRAKDGNVAADVVERGDTILNMLKSGKADNITDAMLDMGDSVKNTQLNQYLFQNYDLPMDEASRMARAQEMGFDRIVFHGSKDDFQSLDPEMAEDRTYGTGNWVTDDPDIAATYTGDIRSNPQTYPMRLNTSDFGSMDFRGKNWSSGPEFGYMRYPRAYGKFSDKVSDIYEDWKSWASSDNAARAASDAGLSGVELKNIVDVGPNIFSRADRQKRLPETATSFAVLDPSAARSQFARFDPRLSHLSNLTAANMSPLGGLVAQGMVSQEELEDYLRQKGL